MNLPRDGVPLLEVGFEQAVEFAFIHRIQTVNSLLQLQRRFRQGNRPGQIVGQRRKTPPQTHRLHRIIESVLRPNRLYRSADRFYRCHTMAFHLTPEQFGRIIESALADLPEPFAGFLQHVPVEVRPRPTPEQLHEAGLEAGDQLFGLYVGHPLTQRSVELSGVMPDVIYIFQQPHEQACDSRDDLIHEIRTTVLHEIGHHFGMDEDDLAELGYG